MPVIYCSFCADTSSLCGERCLHCGAVSEESYELNGQALLALLLVLSLSIGTVWGFARTDSPHAEITYAVDSDPMEQFDIKNHDNIAQNKSTPPPRTAKYRDV